MEENITKLAKNIVNYSCNIQPKEKVLIESSVGAEKLVNALIKEIYAKNAYPFVHLQSSSVTRNIIFGTSSK